MCDQTNPYKPGDIVWAKTVGGRIWWPGTVVDPSTTAEDYLDYINRRKNVLIVVAFEEEEEEKETYEGIINMNHIYLYNCSRKTEFLKKGYGCFKKQLKEKKDKLHGVDMNKFVRDVRCFENRTGGDPNIFEQFEEKSPPRPLVNINQLFVTNKSLRKKSKINLVRGRKSLPEPKISTPLPMSKKPSTPKTKATRVATTLSSSIAPGSKGFVCYFGTHKKCPFITNRYEHLKRHMAEHKAQDDELKNQPSTSSQSSSIKSQSTSSGKRNYARQKKSNTKRMKYTELLKEWDEDEDANEEASEVGSKKDLETITTEDENKDEDKNNDEDKKSLDTKNIENEENDVDQMLVGNKQNDGNTNQDHNSFEHLALVVQNENSVEAISVASTENLQASVPNTIFDFDEDDGSNVIPDLRPKSDPSYSCIEGEINKSTKYQPPGEESYEDKGQSNEIECSELLENTINTLDQISNLEESMNDISSSRNKLSGDETENETMIKTNEHAGNYLISCPEEIQQPNDNEASSTNNVVIDDVNKISCSNVDGTPTQNVDSKDDPSKKERFECLLKKFPTPDWIKTESWGSLPGNSLNEAMKFLTFDTEEKVDHDDFGLLNLKPSLINVPFEPTFVHKISDFKPISTPMDVIRIRVPITDDQEISDEDFLKNPVVQECIELKKAGITDAFTIKFPEGSYVVEDEVTKAKRGTD